MKMSRLFFLTRSFSIYLKLFISKTNQAEASASAWFEKSQQEKICKNVQRNIQSLTACKVSMGLAPPPSSKQIGISTPAST